MYSLEEQRTEFAGRRFLETPLAGLLAWLLVGNFHAIARTVAILVLWYAFPEYRFIAIPFSMVFMYLLTLLILTKRWKRIR